MRVWLFWYYDSKGRLKIKVFKKHKTLMKEVSLFDIYGLWCDYKEVFIHL